MVTGFDEGPQYAIPAPGRVDVEHPYRDVTVVAERVRDARREARVRSGFGRNRLLFNTKGQRVASPTVRLKERPG